ncbi:MAG: alpha/beta fold hydrolase [Candidatus Moranbacteria bacterium]|nr:alpha/beta fold hydrolase [Candidatus Moranbacteria bacterium]
MIIKNRKKENIAVTLDKNNKACGLVFVMHGLGGFKEQSHIQMLIDIFKKKNYTVVSFDTTNSFGESGGNYSDATATNYYEDLEDVIAWAKNNSWYEEPFVLTGHSLGGLSVALFAEKYPNRVKALAPLSAVVSGKLWKQIQDKKVLENWKKDGTWKRGENVSKPGTIKILKWAFAEDIMKYDLLENVEKLTMPVLMIVGRDDSTVPVFHQKILFEKLSGKKELHVIENAGHTFREKNHLSEIEKILAGWLDSLD